MSFFSKEREKIFINYCLIICLLNSFNLYQCNFPYDLLRLFSINYTLSRFEEFSIPPEIVKKINELEENTRPVREMAINVVREYNNLVLSIKTPIEQTIFQEEFNRLIIENISRLQTRLWNSNGNETYLVKFKRRIEDVREKIIKFKENTESIKSKCDEISKNVFFELEKNNDIYEKNQLIEQLRKKRHKAASFINEKAKEILDLIMLSYKFIENVEDPEVFKGFKNYIEEIAEKGFYDAVEKALVNSITSMHRAMLGYKNANPSPFLKINIQMTETKNKKETIGSYEFNPSYPDLKNMIMDTLKDMQNQALNFPDIIKMFVEANENFIKKLEKKKNEDKINRPMINSINNLIIGEIKEIEKPEKPTERKNLKVGKGANQASAPTAGKNLKIGDKKNINKDQDPNQHKQDNEKNQQSNQNNLINMFGQGDRIIKFPKADEAKRSFTNDLKEKGLEKEFNKKLQTWKDCQTIKDYAKILEEEESERFINDKFEKFLIEPNSQIKDLTLSLKENINKPNEFKTDLSAVDNKNTIPETIVISFFLQFDATPVKHKLIDMCENIVTFNLQYVMEKTKKELVIKVEEDIKEQTKSFEKEPETKELYKEMLDMHQKCVEEMPFLFKKIDAAKELVTQIIAVNLNKGPNDDLIERVQNLEKKKDIYENLLEDTEKMLKRAKEKLANQVNKEYLTFKQNVEDMKKEFLSNIPDKIEGSIKEEIEETNKAQTILEIFYNKCKAFKNEEELVKKGLTLFKDDLNIIIEGNKDLLEVEEQIKSLFKIWEIKKQMNEIVYRWCHTQFYSFDIEQMAEERQRIENDLITKCKDMKTRQIYLHMKDQLELYYSVFIVLGLLRDEAMNSPSHWDKIKEIISDSKIDPHSIDFNFEKILELKFENYKDKIEKRVEYAREQQKVDKGLEKIKQEWKRNDLKFDFKGENFKLLSNDKMINDLEEHLTKVAEYKSTPYYDDFKEKIDNLENELNKISDSFTLLKQVLEKWNYLKNVFSKDIDDISQQAGIEIANFKTNNGKFLLIFESFKRLVTVKECFLQANLEKDLKDLYVQFSGIERGLYNLLETKRNNFERLYFLSNDDFLELLGNGEDPKVINFHLSKLFSGIDRIEISENKKTIEYVYDSLNEKFKISSVLVTSVIETWLKDLEKGMIESLEKTFSNIYQKKNNSNDRWSDFTLNKNDDIEKKLADENYNGQILLTMTQYLWRRRIENEMAEINKIEKADKTEKGEVNWDAHYARLKETLFGVVSFLEEDSKRDGISKKNKLILYNYILIIKHHLDLTLFLKQQKIRSTDNYDWQKILKINIGQSKKVANKRYNNRAAEDRNIITIEQLNNVASYGYEYIGNKERLVITTLTERCFLTMMTAIFYHRGGSLQGPAGTGKTETIKDLSRNLAKYVIVFNCSNKNNYNTMATLFMGILKTGAWCCFDEFNRIDVEVLSVIRIQLTTIYDGLRAHAKNILFKNTYVEVNKDLAIFITMNPTYIFRSELPDNLKTLFRPISLMMADRQRICEIRFHAEGYQFSAQLAQKLVTSFDVMEQQLSKQAHYDFSLRTMIAILLHGGTIKNSVIASDEHALLKIAIGDIIRPKLVSDDEDIFEAIINSIFLDGKHDERGDQLDRDEILRKDIKEEIVLKSLCGSPYLVNQIILIHNYMKNKHGIMLVGESLSGKTTSIKILQSVSKRLAKKDQKVFTDVHITTIYPKSVELDDLYGKQISSSQSGDNIYVEGLLPYHIKDLCNMVKDEKTRLNKWLCLDGPVDTLWIESMNTLLDETKMLSLPSGYRINLKQDVKIIFETENLVQATPATVSRVGLVFFESDKLTWFPIARNWLDKRKTDKNWYELIAKWFDKYVYGILAELKEYNHKLNYVINYHENHIVLSLIKIFESFLDEISQAGTEANNEEGTDKYWDFAERLFIFSLIWAIGGCFDEQSRVFLDGIIKKYSPNFPPHLTIFDFIVNPEKDEWGTWEEKMIQYWPSSSTPFNEIFVPTVDITRNKTIVQNLIKNDHNPLIIGGVCTGKTSLVKMIFKTLDSTKYQCISVNLSYGIKPKNLQEEIEYYFEKRNNKLFPPSNKKCICFIDDLNLPKKDQFGCQVTNEMLRQCIELDGWYSTENLTYVNIRSMLMFASTCLRGTDKSDISKRFASKFVPLNLMTPNDNTKGKIFNTVLSFYLSNFPNEDIKKLSEGITMSMIGLYNSIIEKDAYLPTPMKCHYIFNLRDVSKIFEAISKVKGAFYTREYFVKLWVHECFRTLHDRFLFEDDKNLFRDLISKQIEVNLGITLRDCQIKDNRDSIFVDFVSDSYEEVNDFDELKKTILSKIENNKNYSHMVFFDQAINYICFLNRILNKNIGGHGLCIGTGASGRTSSIKIACELSNFKIVQINAAKEMKIKEWREFIKQILKESGQFQQKTALIIQENDIFSDDVIEDLSYIMQIGMIPNILNEDWDQMKQDSVSQNIQNMSMEGYVFTFKKLVSENLKIFINLSPLSEKLRNYTRVYPTIIDYTTAVKFIDWPESALIEVSKFHLDFHTENAVESEIDLRLDVAEILSKMHLSVFNVLEKMDYENKRKAYFTSSNFVQLIKTFNKYFSLKKKIIKVNIEKYNLGIQKISVGKEKIDAMSYIMEEKNKEETQKLKELEKIIDEINEKKKTAMEQENDLEYEREKNAKNRKFFEKNMEESKKELEEAEKPMKEAHDLIEEKISRKKLAEFRGLLEVSQEIKNVFYALMAIFNRPTNWDSVKSYLQDISFEDLVKIENLPVTEKGNFAKIQSYTKEFNLEKLARLNQMIPYLAQYIILVEKFFKAKWNAEVKRKNLDEANKQLISALQTLNDLESKLNDIKFEIEKLEQEKRDRELALEKIKDETGKIKTKLERANFLINAFKNEEVRWAESLLKNQESLKNLLGNTILAAGILTYFGVFSSKYREDLLKNYWIPILNKKDIKISDKFEFLDFISNQREIQDWVMQGLPNDNTFKENAVIIRYSLNIPLIIDPQDQALVWIKNMNKQAIEEKKFRQFTPQTQNYLKSIHECIYRDTTVIINNIGERLGMDLEDFLKGLNKDRCRIYLMTKVPNPHFYPEVSSSLNIINFLVNEKGLEEQLLSVVVEIEKEDTESKIRQSIDSIFHTSKALDKSEETILQYLNDAGDNYLEEDQLINELKRLKDAAIKSAEELRVVRLNLDKIEVSREEYRPLARKVSKIFFVLYSMNNINNMYEFSLHSYKELFKNSIKESREKITSSESSDERIKSIERVHINKIIVFTNQSLFENHRLLFSLQLCLAMISSDEEEFRKELEKGGISKLQQQEHEKEREKDNNDLQYNPSNKVNNFPDMFNQQEFSMLLQTSLDSIDSKGFHKPGWISDENAWKFIINLENKIPDFKGIISSFTHNNLDWHKWYISKDIEKDDLPVEWESKCTGLKSVRKLLFIKALRPDKFSTALKLYINRNLGVDLRETPINLKDILLKDVNNYTPLLIIHGNGIDPSESLQKIWEVEEKKEQEIKDKAIKESQSQINFKDDKEKKEKKFLITTLNQDQLVHTLSDLTENAKIGGWVYLANTHLTLQSIPQLEKTLDDLRDVHKDFRLIISTNPHPKYPISFLQRCEKITFEMPKGIGTNMARLLDDLQKDNLKLENYERVEKNDFKFSAFCKLVYSLCMFHSILLERRKYKSYGWTCFYDFNNSDFKICFDILKSYMNKFNLSGDQFPWKAIQELVAINYGSRFTNEKDLALLNTYSTIFFNQKVITEKIYNFSSVEPPYLLPDDTLYERFKNSISSDPFYQNKSEFFIRTNFYREEAKKLPKDDPPELFGLHFNAEISSQIEDNLLLIENIRLLSPDILAQGIGTAPKEEQIINKIQNALTKLPNSLNTESAKRKILVITADKQTKFDPTQYSLFLEATRYNTLISTIRSDLKTIESALKGNTTLSPVIESMINLLYEDKVPYTWLNFYLSTKKFSSYVNDLVVRVEFFNKWITNGFTTSYFIGYFTNPNGFITSIKQKYSLENKVLFNRITIDYKVNNEDDDVKATTKNGYIIKGLFIQGGLWDKKTSVVKDENIQDLYSSMPLIIMTPMIASDHENLGTSVLNQNQLLSGVSPLVLQTGPVKHWFPVYYIPIKGDYLGKNSYVMDIPLNILKDKDKDGQEKTEKEYISYWIKKGSCLLMSKND